VCFSVRIHLSDLAVPVTVSMARVRWVRDSQFGIEFIQLPHQDQLRLTQVSEETQEDEAMSIPKASTSPKQGSYTILVVDDDPEMLDFCTLTLTRGGFNVLQALGSTEAAQICSTHVGDIHLVLVDVMLYPQTLAYKTEKQPHIRVHGHTLLNGLLEMRKGLRPVMMSAHSKSELEKNGIAIGDTPFLQKPLFAETLMATIRQQVEGHRLEEAS